MTKFVKLWYRYTFWQRVAKTFTVIASLTTGGLVFAQVEMVWPLISSLLTIGSSLVDIWFNDSNNDGIIDIAQGNGHTIK
jgi:hypothetical protein